MAPSRSETRRLLVCAALVASASALVPAKTPAFAKPDAVLATANSNKAIIQDTLDANKAVFDRAVGDSMAAFDKAAAPVTEPAAAAVKEALATATRAAAPITEPVASAISSAQAQLPPLPPLPPALVEAWSHVDPVAAPLLAAPIVLATYAGLAALAEAFGGAVIDPYASRPGAVPGGATSYNYAAANEFYGSEWTSKFFVFNRLLSLARLTSVFNTKLLIDWRLGQLEKNEGERAKECLSLANDMGPTFIKLGQALSIRTDLIPEAYALELRQLQDAVPPFSNLEAREVLRRELGVRDLSEVFLALSEKPVASASIGQVYRGTLLDGRDVAVKVQRPRVLGDIALDLYILRLLTPLQVRISNAVNKIPTDDSDIQVALDLVDEWGRGFVAEVDYREEARKQIEFTEAMARRGLNAVTAPTVINEHCTSKVLVTGWVEGTRLDRDGGADVPRLCGVAINAYLTMLLDTGTLHCDPHPGNLLRTRDGRLCVLDWGMTLDVPNDLQYGLLEFIAHVNSEDYDAIPADFVNLGFTPPDKLEQVKSSGITEGLSFSLKQLSQGGGPKQIQARVKEEFKQRYGADLSDEELRDKARAEMLQRMEDQLASEGVDVNGMTSVMEEMSRRNKELFQLPPYVLYVSRAFSTLEGIGLSIDEDYSILQECYPYLAKRLITDNSPRAKSALRSMLYGPQGDQSDSVDSLFGAPLDAKSSSGAAAAAAGVAAAGSSGGGGMLSPDKLVEMTSGFTSYTASTTDVDAGGAGMAEASKALQEVLLAEDSYLQEVLLEEAARLADALVRDRFYALAEASPVAVEDVTSFLNQPKHLLDRLNIPAPFRPLALPLTLPGEVARAVSPLVVKSSEDEAVLAAARAIYDQFTKAAAENEGESGGVGSVLSSPQLSETLTMLRNPAMVLNPQSALWTEALSPLQENLPAVGVLLRRFALTLLSRVNMRLMDAPDSESLTPVARQLRETTQASLVRVLDTTGTTPSAPSTKVEVVA